MRFDVISPLRSPVRFDVISTVRSLVRFDVISSFIHSIEKKRGKFVLDV